MTTSDRTLNELITAIYSVDYRVQEQAIDELISFGASAVASLLDVLRSFATWQDYEGDTRTHDSAIDGLVRLCRAHPASFDLVPPLLSEPAWGARYGAVAVLRELGDPRAIRPLVEALGNADTELQLEIGETLNSFTQHGTLVLDWLMAGLRHPQANVRLGAAQVLSQIHDVRAIPALIDSLYDRETSVRLVVIRALGAFADNRALQPLRQLLRDGDSAIRAAAGDAMRALGYTPENFN
jgi:HEAT repeat protein